MIKVVRAYDLTSGEHVFSVMADDKGFKYVMQPDYKVFDADKHVKMLMEKVNEDKANLKAVDYINIACYGLSNFKYGSAREEASYKIAAKEEQVSMMKSALKYKDIETGNSSVAFAREDLDQVLSDYPELYDQLEGNEDNIDPSITADGMVELVMAALGSVDPEGPNAWLLDYMDGKTADGFVGDLVFGVQPNNDEIGKK